jgi:hypothetical protein
VAGLPADLVSAGGLLSEATLFDFDLDLTVFGLDILDCEVWTDLRGDGFQLMN